MVPVGYNRTMTIEKLLISAGLSMREAAEKSGLDRTTIWRWHRGLSRPQIGQARRLAQVVRQRGQKLGDVIQAILLASQSDGAASSTPVRSKRAASA